MSQTLLQITAELTKVQIEAGMVAPETVNELLRQTFDTLASLKAQEEGIPAIPQPAEQEPKDWRKSITKLTVACLECGREMKQLTRRHLQEHGLNYQTYRSKYGIPPIQPLSARDTTRRRQQIVQEVKPWEKTPRYRIAQEKRSATAGAAAEEIETPALQNEARPKRQRKTTPKKQSRRKRSRGE